MTAPLRNSGARGRAALGPKPFSILLAYECGIVCQYCRAGPVSSEKDETTADAGVEGGDGDPWCVGTATAVMGSYHPLPAPLAVITRAANTARGLRSRTRGRLYACDAVLEQLAQDLEHMPATLRQLIQAEDAVVRQRHLARHRHVGSADQPHIRDRMMESAKRTGRHQGGAVAREAGDAMDACGLKGFGQGHRRQDSGEPAGQHRRAGPRGAEQEEVMVTTPASRSTLPEPSGIPTAIPIDPLRTEATA